MSAKRSTAFPPTVPRVYVGPRAERSLWGERGVLLGTRRSAWVDVLEFDPHPKSRFQNLVDSRFHSRSPWDVVGLSLSNTELRQRGLRLLRQLVPGDVLMTESGARFHSGERWVPVPLVRDKKKGRLRRP